MPFWRNYYHLIWTTKQRAPIIHDDIEGPLFGYIVKKASQMGVFVYAINGTEDHVHMVVAIPPQQSVADVVKTLKGSSSNYVNQSIQPNGHFEWQRGYGCLTLGEKQRSIAEEYVRNQKQHHAEQSANHWLEHTSETDEGPLTLKTEKKREDSDLSLIRDQHGSYEISDEIPF